MTEHAPQGILDLFAQIKDGIPSAINGGVVGDSAHTYGYHRGRNYVPASDYSVQHEHDKQGDGEAACGLDISWSRAEDQYTVSRRLLNAKDDSRMQACREFYGSTDGVNVCGWDYAENHSATSDDSHLWHVHLSIHRKFANDSAALRRIGDVITGNTSSSGDDEMASIVYVAKSGQVELSPGEVVTPKFDSEINDPGGVFFGKDEPAHGESGSRLNLDGAHWVSCCTLTAKGLAPDAALLTAVVYCETDGTETGQSPWQKLAGVVGDDFVVDTRAGHSPKGKGLKLRLKAVDGECTVADLKWRVVYWK